MQFRPKETQNLRLPFALVGGRPGLVEQPHVVPQSLEQVQNFR